MHFAAWTVTTNRCTLVLLLAVHHDVHPPYRVFIRHLVWVAFKRLLELFPYVVVHVVIIFCADMHVDPAFTGGNTQPVGNT